MFDGNCLIRRAGITPEGWAQLDMKDAAPTPAFDWTWFLGKPEISREILATALVAISCDKQLAVQIDDPNTAWSHVTRCLVWK